MSMFYMQRDYYSGDLNVLLRDNPEYLRPIELQMLSYGADAETLINVAIHPRTPMKILRKLSKHKNDNVRKAVASNPTTSSSVLNYMFTNITAPEIYAIVENPNCSEEILTKISYNKNTHLLWYVAKHDNTPGEVLHRIIQDEYFQRPDTNFTPFWGNPNLLKETVLWVFAGANVYQEDYKSCLRIASQWDEHKDWPQEWVEEYYGVKF